MPNTLATPTWVMKEVSREFVNDLTFLANVNRTYDEQYKQSGAKVGNTVLARLPQRFMVTDGQAYQPQALYDATVPITLTNQKNVAFGYSSAEATTQLDDIRSRYTVPGGEAMANACEVLAFNAVYRDVYSSVGTPGTAPNNILTYLQAQTKLTDLATPLRGRCAVLDPLAMQTIVTTSPGSFNPSAVHGENYEEGMFGRRQLGIDKWFQDIARPTHTTGTFTSSTPQVKGAGQTGSTLDIDGWASGATSLKKGDVFTLDGVYSINPMTYASTGRLQQFVVTADTSDSSGETATLPISPAIITSGALQTVDSSPADNAGVTVVGATSKTSGTLATTATPQSFVYHPDAFAFVMAAMFKPGAGAQSTIVRSKALGFSLRFVEQYQIGTDQQGNRLDMIIGAATVQARLACRVWS